MSFHSGYTKLVRQSIGAASYRSIWKSGDHLLLMTSNGYVERYQRFQYADIKTFLILPSERNVYLAWVWIALTLVFSVFAGIAIQKGATLFVAGPLALLFLICLLWNYLLGPSCNVYIVTGVQTSRLPIRRRRRAEKFLAQIGPEIAAAQSGSAVAMEVTSAEPPPFTP